MGIVSPLPLTPLHWQKVVFVLCILRSWDPSNPEKITPIMSLIYYIKRLLAQLRAYSFGSVCMYVMNRSSAVLLFAECIYFTSLFVLLK